MNDFGFHPVPKPGKATKERRNKIQTKQRTRKKEGSELSKEQVREEVKRRDGNWCLLSGKPGPGLHLHRVVYSGMGGGNGKYEVWNCVLLSNEMHALVHSSKRTWMPMLLEYLTLKKLGKDPSAVLRKMRDKAKESEG
ncbi:hypothetical protein BBD41_03300 [Paenibacillus ihbetae]|uniref:HNH nuclease domain-containing protein n=1 Tax=Paenibacillus ihbetae TaxID=1870820 RepID=A0A1B2DVE2_9BACL|nr:hypothetical protein [Paenibacillus ihbetae]ANY71686.1 hypothetical protein BBD41_03300 [Paenibacillus ihbetae]